MLRFSPIFLLLGLTVSGCAQSTQEVVLLPPPPARDRLYTPRHVDKSRLEYTSDYQTFAPIMTKRVAYPTQEDANNAFARSQWHGQTGETIVTKEGIKRREAVQVYLPTTPAVAVRLFACAPGAINEITMRIDHFKGHIVHCATDFLDPTNNTIVRLPMNYYYWNHVWQMRDPDVYLKPTKWRTFEPSTPHSNGLIGDRY